MDFKLIFEGKITLEECEILGDLGFEFIIEGGEITHVYHK